MNPMDMNWFFDHKDLDDLRLRAIEKLKNSPFPSASESRWLKLNREMMDRVLKSQDYRIEYYNISLKENLGTKISPDNPIMDDGDFAYENQNGIVESQELHYHCAPNSYDWIKMIDDSIEAILSCVVFVRTDGSFDRSYRIDLIISLDSIQEMGKDKFSSFMDSFN